MEWSANISSCSVSVDVLCAGACSTVLRATACSAIVCCPEQSANCLKRRRYSAPVHCVLSAGVCTPVLHTGSCAVFFRRLEQSAIFSSRLKWCCPIPHCIFHPRKFHCAILRYAILRCTVFRCTIFRCPDKLGRWIVCRAVFWIIRQAFWLILRCSIECSRQLGCTVVRKRSPKQQADFGPNQHYCGGGHCHSHWNFW
jgi:hypothetical protein